MKNRPRSILIADNNRANAHGMRIHLEQAGFKVFVAYDGEQAAVLAARQRFELMITNLERPTNGCSEFCHHVREELGLKEVPIIASSPTGWRTDSEGPTSSSRNSRVVGRTINPSEVVEMAQEAVGYMASAN